MAMKTKVTKLSKQEQAAQGDLPGFRVIIRGTTKDDKRVRRVRTIHAANDGAACELAGNDPKNVAGLDNVYVSVLIPLDEHRALREAAGDAWPFQRKAAATKKAPSRKSAVKAKKKAAKKAA